MKQKRLRIILFLIVILMGTVLSFAFSIGSPVLAIGVFLAGGIAIYIFKNRQEGIMEDERIYQISQKASNVTLRIVTLGLAIGGVVLISMKDLYPGYTYLGLFMTYASCWVILLYSLFYIYYNREFGG